MAQDFELYFQVFLLCFAFHQYDDLLHRIYELSCRDLSHFDRELIDRHQMPVDEVVGNVLADLLSHDKV
jgi:hypothetical protein